MAEHYARVRGVPQNQVLRVTVDATADEIERPVFERQIQDPIAAWIRRNSAQDRILFIVLTKGVPLRIRGTSGRDGTQASVDSELTLLYRRLTGEEPPLVGPLANPYFLGDAPVAQATPFSHKAFDIYLVTRLDGYTVDDVLKLIDRGAAPSRDGRILLDERAAADSGGGNTWLKAAADWMAGHGFGDRVVLETSGRVLTGEKNVLGYYSWGSNDPAITTRRFGFGFVPGAIAGMFVSTDARTFREPPAGWATGSWTDRTKFFAGSPQSLSGDLIREGVTGVAGHVAEPYLDATIRPNILFPAYLSGFNLAEAFYLAMPFVSWQTVVVGDPLCAPFPRKALQPSDIDAGIDPSTGLPALFSARRLRVAIARGVRTDAARLVARAEALSAKDDKAGARAALEEATALEPRMQAAQLALARDYELSREYDKAIERYRLALSGECRRRDCPEQPGVPACGAEAPARRRRRLRGTGELAGAGQSRHRGHPGVDSAPARPERRGGADHGRRREGAAGECRIPPARGGYLCGCRQAGCGRRGTQRGAAAGPLAGKRRRGQDAAHEARGQIGLSFITGWSSSPGLPGRPPGNSPPCRMWLTIVTPIATFKCRRRDPQSVLTPSSSVV